MFILILSILIGSYSNIVLVIIISYFYLSSFFFYRMIIFVFGPRPKPKFRPNENLIFSPIQAHFIGQQANRGLPSSLYSQRIDQALEHQPARPSALGPAHTNRSIGLFLPSSSRDRSMHPSQPAQKHIAHALPALAPRQPAHHVQISARPNG